ncbi:hypothetical protein OS175_11875 [Marinicella sp. S1101]|uniref:hypothetical protein n=1 Tax=Marinicella marina TaxID=2996016 RepID=UPI002260968E|nr:hypothetical protein [Marinicella marina]MCX7554581.1 hypothetical protein [Marinicella marina]MDJ1141035.1 hypothetical protein [Marinicella marina]
MKYLYTIILFNFTTVLLAVNDLPQQGVNFASVGLVSDQNCDYNTINDAILGGHDEIRLVNITFNERIDIVNNGIEIKGGYANCTAANADNPIRLTTTIEPIKDSGINITNGNDNYTVKLSNLWITGASGNMFSSTAGINATGENTTLMMENVAIVNNQATGLNLINLAAASLKNILISGNSLQGNGGGISCDSSTVVVYGASSINSNSVTQDTRRNGITNEGNGGGVYATNGCDFTYYSGPPQQNSGLNGILSNNAAGNGGGIFANLGATISLIGTEVNTKNETFGDSTVPVLLLNNTAGGVGGGVYLDDENTALTASGIRVIQNTANADGGGLYIESDATATITRLPGGCWSNNKCNLFQSNDAGTNSSFGGAIFVGGAQLAVGNAWFQDNLADDGAAIAVAVGSATLEGNVFYRNDASTDYDANSAVLLVFNSVGTLAYNTFVDNNSVVANIQVAATSNITQVGNIIYDLATTSFDISGNSSAENYCIYTNESSQIVGTNIITDTTDPFIDRINGDFHISYFQLRDACDAVLYTPSLRDFDNQTRGFDDPIADLDGPFDIGADEDYSSDVIFKNGFD